MWWRITKNILALAALLLIIGGICLGSWFLIELNWAKSQLASLNDRLYAGTSNPTRMLARDGKTILYTSSLETRDPITDYHQIPQNVINATLAAEDRRFMEHNGIDFKALVRSVLTDVREKRSAQGASTITMQLAKLLYTSTEKTMTRKMRDMALAVEIEKTLSKQQILTDYLNQVYYGQGAYGIKAASEVYFNKSNLSKLTVAEAALLARLVRRPSEENPYKSRKKAIANRDDVLAIERDEGWISENDYKKAVKEKVHLAPKHFGSGEQIWHAGYFVRWVLDTLKRDLPDVDLKAGGYTIETTLDPDLEKVTERAVADKVAEYRRDRVSTGACMLMLSDGQVLSMVGGTDFTKHQYNAITQGHRQPGSSFKPIVYSTALQEGAIRPGDSISSGYFEYDDPVTGPYTPHNDNGFGGMVSIRTAIASSINTAAVRVCQKVGPDKVVQYAHDIFGYNSDLKPFLSIALGSSAVSPLEQARAYSVFMRQGERAEPYGIVRVVGPDGKVVKTYEANIQKTGLDPDVAATMSNDYLRAVVTSGTATRARVIDDARGKTGTTQDFHDAWFCGYTNNLLAVAWVANEHFDKNHNPPFYYEPMLHIFGGHVPTEIWVSVMKAAQAKYGAGTPPAPRHMERSDLEVDTQHEKPINIDSGDAGDNGDSTDTTDAASQNETDSPTPAKAKRADRVDGTDNSEAIPPNADPNSAADTPAISEPPKPPKRKRRERAPATEMVTVEVCADTGLLATDYCPETVARTFVKGTEPKRYCTKHGPGRD